MSKSLKSVEFPSTTPQSQKSVKGQKKNSAGGFTFAISDMDRAKRFLILGSESNFYTSGQQLSADNAKVIKKLAEDVESSRELVDTIVEISTAGRAPKNDYALFALAMASSFGEVESKQYALAALPKVARTATHLFQFVSYALQFRGWGRSLKTAVGNWYLEKDVDKLAYQLVKYRSREGWTHRDTFRVAHPKTQNENLKRLGDWLLRDEVKDGVSPIVRGFEAVKTSPQGEVSSLVKEYGLTWEMIPSEKRSDDVWRSLLEEGIPLTALVRNLATLTAREIISPMSKYEQLVVERLSDADYIQKSRLHPLSILLAYHTYAAGRGERGCLTWTPNQKVLKALNGAFYKAFKNVEPANKRTLIGLDVSGSMGYSYPMRNKLSSRQITAAFSLVTEATEPWTHTIGFTGYASYGGSSPYSKWGYRDRASDKFAEAVREVGIDSSQTLEQVDAKIAKLPMGATDCALPMLYALEKNMEVDTFVIWTDNETWVGPVHPHEALEKYRKATGIPAKLVVASTEATRFSIANPSDAGMLDVSGFDSAVPSLIADFSRGI